MIDGDHVQDVAAKRDRTRWHPPIFATAAIMVYILVLSGGVVCITDSSHGCPDWPTCHERWFPPNQMNSIIEYSHRILTPLTLPFLIAAAVVACRRYRSEAWIVVPTLASIACLAAVVVFGALVILTGLPRGWAAADLGTALMALALMVAAASGVAARRGSADPPLRPIFTDGLSRLVLAAATLVYAILVGGVLVSRPGALMRCLNWPGSPGPAGADDLFGRLYLLRFGLAMIATLMIVALVIRIRARDDDDRRLRRLADTAGVLVVTATVVAALIPTPDSGVMMPALNMALATALWAVLAALSLEAGRTAHRRRE